MQGFRYMAKGLDLIMAPGLKRFVLVPLIINVLIFGGLIAGGVMLFDNWMSSLLESLPEWLEFLYWVMWLLFLLIILAVLFFCFTIFANIVAAPFNALLSIRVEDRVRGSTAWREGEESFLAIVSRTVWREVAKLLYLLPRFIALVILSLIPGLNVIAPPLWLLFGAWMMAVEYSDYGADNNGVGFGQLREALARVRFTSLGFGIIVYGMMLIPVLNLLVMPAAVAGGTVFWVERLSEHETGS